LALLAVSIDTLPPPSRLEYPPKELPRIRSTFASLRQRRRWLHPLARKTGRKLETDIRAVSYGVLREKDEWVELVPLYLCCGSDTYLERTRTIKEPGHFH
jgi:hypothetical protein